MNPFATIAPTLTLLKGPLPVPPKADPRIAEHLPLARSMARKFLPRMGGMLEFDDLVSIALAATWEAAPAFQDDRGVKFGQFARSCMRLALRREQREVWNERRRAWLQQTSIHPDGDDSKGIDLPSPLPNPERAYATFEIAMAVLNTSTGRNRELLRQLFLGETLTDAGEQAGVCREQARQIQERAFRIVRRRVERRIAKQNLDDPDRRVHLREPDLVEPMPTNQKGAPRNA